MKQTDTDIDTQNAEDTQEHPASTAHGGAGTRAGTSRWVGERLGRWQPAEVRLASSFAECRGLASEQLEDLYQDTTLALLGRTYTSEEHLRNALRHGIKQRALNLHRNQRRRTQILTHSAPSMQRIEEGRQSQKGPEAAALSEQDRLIATEFLTELDELEQRVFALTADGMRYRAIASLLEIPVNEARKAAHSCERKRQRFQRLYDTGRLCGYRANTIQALQDGQPTSVELARRAFAHLDACTSCRAEHRTNAKRLSLDFRDQIAALLPTPAILRILAQRGRSIIRGATLHQHAHARLIAIKHSGAAGWRVTALLFSGGAGAKVTSGVLTLAVIAGGTVGATHALGRHATVSRRHTTIRAQITQSVAPRLNKTSAPPDAGASRVNPRTRTRNAHPATHVPTSIHRSASGAADATGAQSAEREFGIQPAPKESPSAPIQGSATDRGSGKAEREFGLPPSGG